MWQNGGMKEYYSCPVIYLKLIACIGFITFQVSGKNNNNKKKKDARSDVHFSDGIKSFKSSPLLLFFPSPGLCNVFFALF